jgi:hypothetical protein
MRDTKDVSDRRLIASAALLLVGVVLLAIAALPKRGGETGLLRVAVATPAEYRRLVALGVDVVAAPPRRARLAGEFVVEVLATKKQARRIAALGLPIEWIDEDHTATLAAKLAAGGGPKSATDLPPGFGTGAMGGYYTLAEIVALLDHYAATYPHIVAPKVVIGTSVEGRPIHAIKISDQPLIAEAEPGILIDALHHAREPASMQTLFLLLHRLVTGYGFDPAITSLVDGREIHLVPCLNPDGYVFNQSQSPAGGGLWRKNRRGVAGACGGVDLNRNYPAQFGIDDIGSSGDPCAESYRGSAPLSEPESTALDAYAAQLAPRVAVSLHAHGRQLLHPRGAQLAFPSDAAAYDEHGEILTAHAGYLFGPVSDVLGLVNGNYLDHFHEHHHAEAWAFELGTSFWPTIPELIAVAESNVPALLDLIAFAGADPRPRSLVVSEKVEAGNGSDGDGILEGAEIADVRVTLRNTGRAASGALTIAIESVDPKVEVIAGKSTTTLAPLGALSGATTTAGHLSVRLPIDAAPGSRVELRVTASGIDVERSAVLAFDVGASRPIARDDVELDLGWRMHLPGDTATTGRWTRADPLGVTQGLEVAQPEHDATAAPGKHCFVTGNTGTIPGGDDVDNGFTTLLSPVFDLAAATDPRLTYRRFYWCSKADQRLDIALSNDGGVTYHLLESVGGRPNQWTAAQWRIADHLTPTAQMRLRVIARDDANASVVEAALDDLEIHDFGVAPHLFVMGRPRLGGAIELQIAKPPGATTVLIFTAAHLAISPLHVGGLAGDLLLDPATLALIGSAPLASSGLTRLPLTVPSTPALLGASLHLQAITTGDTPRASNATTITVE